MFIRKYLVWWRYTDHGHVFKSKLYSSEEEAMEFVKRHDLDRLNYDIEEFLFEAH